VLPWFIVSNFPQRRMNTLPGAAPNVLALSAERSTHRLATGILLVYLFLVMSRGIETLAVAIGVNLHLTPIMLPILLVSAIFTGGLLQAMKTPVVIMFTALTCWLMVTVATSQWHGGSFKILTSIWLTSYACVLLVPSLISTLDQCRKMCYALAFSLIPILGATVVFQAQVAGRDQTFFGTLGNPNELAFYLLLMIPFAVFVINSESVLSWKTIVCALAIVWALIKTLKTGSRSGMLCMAACFLIVLLSGTMRTKFKMFVFTALLAAIALPFVSGNVLRRYATVFNGTSYETTMSADEMSAVESTRARKMLFGESVRVMLEHPLFGVGPGIFSAALAMDQKGRGEFQTWHEAHNSFTQLGSEAGIPALIIFIALVVYCLKRTVSIYRRTRRDPNQMAICRMAASLGMALVIFTISATFGTYSYSMEFPILAGLVQALDMCVRKELKTAPVIVSTRLPTRLVAPRLNSQVPNYVRDSRLRHTRA
jgi:O-antigen ligase